MNKTTVLFITDPFYRMAGSERNLFELATRLNSDKFIPIVFALSGGKILNDLSKRGVEVKNLRLKKIYSFKGIWEGIKLLKFIKERNIKIVVTYHESSDFWGGIIAKISRVPIIISSRRDMGHLLKKRHILIYRMINPLFNKIITVSDAVKNNLFNKQHILWHKLITVHNGVDTDLFFKHIDNNEIREKLSLENNIPVIGILASVTPIKGQRYFIEAIPSVLEKFPEAHFLIIGTCDNIPYYKELKELIIRLQIEKKVIFTGEITAIPEIISIMDICVLSSINEGFPNAVLEYMAAGKPVVATSVGGTPEAVVSGKTGFLIPPCNPKALSQAILSLLNNKALAEKMGAEGKTTIDKKFSLKAMLDNIEDLYGTLLLENQGIRERIVFFNLTTLFKITKKILKSFFVISVYGSGILTIIKKRTPNDIKILAYHRICNGAFSPLDMNISPSVFEEHIRYIKKYYNPISMIQAVNYLEQGNKIHGNSIVITFDDGYKDNYKNAFPILKKYEVPATIFVSVEAINTGMTFWYDSIVRSLRNTNKKFINLDNFNMKKYSLVNAHKKLDAIIEIVEFIKYWPPKKRNQFVKYLVDKLEPCSEATNNTAPILNWDEIKDMSESGISFGSHGMTHSILTTLDPEEIKYEITESKRILREQIGEDIRLFSYPNGGEKDFNQEIINLLIDNGYRAACTLIRGKNTNTSLFTLRRYCVTKGMISGINGHFSKSIFELQTSEIGQK